MLRLVPVEELPRLPRLPQEEAPERVHEEREQQLAQRASAGTPTPRRHGKALVWWGGLGPTLIAM